MSKEFPLIHYHSGDNLAVECKIIKDKYDTNIFTRKTEHAQWSGAVLTPELASVMMSCLRDYMKYNEKE